MTGTTERPSRLNGTARWAGVMLTIVLAAIAVTVQWGVVTTKLDHVEKRLDELIVFKGLARDDLYEIVELELQKVRGRLADHGLKLELTNQAIDYLIDKGYNPDFGARPLRRLIEREIEDPLSEEILRGNCPEGSIINVVVRDDKLIFEFEPRDDAQAPKKAEAET